MAARLIVSLALADDGRDVVAGAEPFADALGDRGLPLSLLVRPVGPAGPLAPCSRIAGWLRERRGGGDALVLHGYDHSRCPIGPRRRPGRPAEFAALPAHEAGLRLAAAQWVTDRAGLAVDAFAPPGRRASPGTLTALTARGFAVCADDAGVHLLAGPVPTLVRGRPLRFRDLPAAPARARLARVLVAEAARATRRGGVVRIRLRGADLRLPERVDAVLAAVDAALARGAVGGSYASSALLPRTA